MNKLIATILFTAATSMATVSMAAPAAPVHPAKHVTKQVKHAPKKEVKKPLAKKDIVKKPMTKKHVVKKAVVVKHR